MRRLIVSEWVTLDGVFDATTMGKWFAPYDSEERRALITTGIVACDAIVLGRATYEMLWPHWSKQTNNDQGPADKLNSVAKYVVSSSLDTAEWNNTSIIKGNVEAEIRALKERAGGDMLIMGSATLVQSLMETGLVDEYQFLVHPIVMGAGKRFFKDGMQMTRLKLVEVRKISLGVNVVRYEATAE